MKLLTALLLSSLVLGMMGPVEAADANIAALDKVFGSAGVDAGLFAQSFLSQVPIEQVRSITATIKSQLGDYKSATPQGDGYLLTFTKGTAVAHISLDGAGKIAGLLVNQLKANAASLDDALQKLTQLPGTVSYLVLEGTRERATLSADTPMSIGSTFKLSVLTALRKQIEAGKRHWTDVIALTPGDKSLPSGMLQDWPDGSHLTLETLATLMISRSDNTATDVLIHALGREAIEPYAYGNVPLLTTRNMFALKSKAGAALRDRWRSGNAQQRRALLGTLDGLAIPQLVEADIQPRDLDVEWHYTLRQLCALMQGVSDLPLMSVNPGVAQATDWKHVAYKGGSDAGVLNMTTMLRSNTGKTYCVSATLNNKDAAVDLTPFAAAYGAVLDQLKD